MCVLMFMCRRWYFSLLLQIVRSNRQHNAFQIFYWMNCIKTAKWKILRFFFILLTEKITVRSIQSLCSNWFGCARLKWKWALVTKRDVRFQCSACYVGRCLANARTRTHLAKTLGLSRSHTNATLLIRSVRIRFAYSGGRGVQSVEDNWIAHSWPSSECSVRLCVRSYFFIFCRWFRWHSF